MIKEIEKPRFKKWFSASDIGKREDFTLDRFVKEMKIDCNANMEIRERWGNNPVDGEVYHIHTHYGKLHELRFRDECVFGATVEEYALCKGEDGKDLWIVNLVDFT